MKKIIITLFVLFSCNLFIYSQVPGKFNYQAVVRNNSGELITNQSVQIHVSIIDNAPTGLNLYSETHKKTTNSYGVLNLVVGEGSDISGSFADINWNQNDKYLNVEIDAGDGYVNLGTVQLLSVPYALHASSAEVLGSKGVYSTSSDTLFVVKDHQGNVVFAVFPDGAQVYVNETSKGKVGGFAVSGRSPSKADVDIFRITPDSTRIYVNDTVATKGKVGGFAVSGRSPSKGVSENILHVTSDSTIIYVNEDVGIKGKVGGFAVSGRSPSKGITTGYLQVTPDSTRIYVKDTVAGFGVSNIEGGTSASLLNLNRQNYFIGHQTGQNNRAGKYNSMIGYEAGYTNSSGSNNIFFGYRSGYSNVSGGNNVFIGTESGYINQYTFQNTYVGYRSGYDLSGAGNTVMGSLAGENAGGGNNTFIGTSAGRKATGGNNTFVGNGAGNSFNTNTGVRNTYIGQAAGSFTTTGEHNVMLGFNAGYLNYEGSMNTFIGYDAGRNIHQGSGNVFLGHEAGKSIDGLSNLLIIENSDNATPLIYGEFDNNIVRITGELQVTENVVANYVSPSDFNLKTNLVKLTSGLNMIESLAAYYFNWTEDAKKMYSFDDKKQLGLMAQDVEKVIPEIVFTSKSGYKSINYTKLTPVLLNAINEQQSQIDQLKAENEELKEKLNEIINMLKKE